MSLLKIELKAASLAKIEFGNEWLKKIGEWRGELKKGADVLDIKKIIETLPRKRERLVFRMKRRSELPRRHRGCRFVSDVYWWLESPEQERGLRFWRKEDWRPEQKREADISDVKKMIREGRGWRFWRKEGWRLQRRRKTLTFLT